MFSFRIKSPERDAFTGSAICMGGVVRDRTSGRLLPLHETETPKSLNKDHTSTPFQSLPNSPLAGVLARSLRRILPLRSEHLSSIVIDSLRELASVSLLRLSQPPRLSHVRWLIESLGAFLKAPRSLTRPRIQLRQKSPRGPLDSFKVLSCVVSHVLKHGAKSDEEITKSVGEFPNV